MSLRGLKNISINALVRQDQFWSWVCNHVFVEKAKKAKEAKEAKEAKKAQRPNRHANVIEGC
jgi:hypothetical protein